MNSLGCLGVPARTQVCTRLEPARVSWQPGSWRLEQGSTSRLESLGGSSRLGQGSTSRLDSRLEPLGGFLAARAQVWTRLSRLVNTSWD